MEFFVILTVALDGNPATVETTVIAEPGATRQEIFRHVRNSAAAECGPEWAQAPVIFFTTEPNSIGQ